MTNPLVMVWNKDNYYLITSPDNHDNVTTYRINRMEDVKIEETPILLKNHTFPRFLHDKITLFKKFLKKV